MPSLEEADDGQWGIMFQKGSDVPSFLEELEGYIKTQAHCNDTKLKNKVESHYISESEGPGIILGTFDARIRAHITKLIPKHNDKDGEPTIYLEKKSVGQIAASGAKTDTDEAKTPKEPTKDVRMNDPLRKALLTLCCNISDVTLLDPLEAMEVANLEQAIRGC